MKPLNNLTFIVISWLLLLSTCLCYLTLGNINNHTQCVHTERAALLRFKHGINETRGHGSLDSWERHTDCCRWSGIVCSNLTGHVITIDLSNQFLKGEVSPSLGEVRHLKHLDLSFNQFYGELPSQFENLHSLSYLSVFDNQLYGELPSQFENLHSLSYLSLSLNQFQGSVFKIISKLCNLKHLHLGINNFTDELSNVFDSLQNCNNNRLITLDLQMNGFWGSVPGSIREFSMLESLYVNSNSLKGILTHVHFSNLLHLRELDLSDNPNLVVNIYENWIPPFQLDVLSLRSCKLGPRFPKWLQIQTNFSYFDVSNSGISDSILVSFWNSLSFNLRYLNMSNNQFYGTLPNMPNISNAFAIDLSSNLFEGIVPPGFANTSYLYLNDNRFSNYSYFLCPQTESTLNKLDLSNNLFYGELPDCWMNFGKLTSLHLENNELSGHIPSSMGTLLNLQSLHLHNNSFSGQFPDVFETCISLLILNLGYNLFRGHIPSWIGQAFQSQSLGALILRNNNFIGEIPESICRLNKLQILDLAINHLSGVIPNCIENFTTMKGSNNQLLEFVFDVLILDTITGVVTKSETAILSWKGKEQRFKQTIRFVKYIDLSSNELSGQIPNGISRLTALGALDLSGNKLSGNIPFEIGNLTALEVLDLSNNHLTGNIPRSLAKVTTLDVMDLSNNHLSGEIPVSTQLQSFDASCYLGNQELCGAPLPSCSKDQKPSNVPNDDNTSTVKGKDENFSFFLGLYISVVLGFIVGFWGVCGTLVVKTSWRHAYFRLLDSIKDRIM